MGESIAEPQAPSARLLDCTALTPEQLTSVESTQTHIRLKEATLFETPKLGFQIPGSQHHPEGPHGRSEKAPQISQTGWGGAGGWLSQAWPDLSPAERPGWQQRAGGKAGTESERSTLDNSSEQGTSIQAGNKLYGPSLR